MKRLRFLGDALRVQLSHFPELTLLGVSGIALGAVCAVLAVIGGGEIPPEGSLIDTATFDVAVGLFVLTLSALAPVVTWTSKGRRRWSRLLVAFTLYGYVIETLQAFRGLDPRFSRVAGPLDQAAGGIFFLVALGILACFGVLGVKNFRIRPSPVVVAIRYGVIASAIGFGVGIWMSLVTNGRVAPEAGNLLVPHAVGFHGLQAIPIVALLLHWSAASRSAVRTMVHLAGLAWLAACTALTWQAGSGHATFELTLATATAVLCFTVFALTALIAAQMWMGFTATPVWTDSQNMRDPGGVQERRKARRAGSVQ
jgi:hypothetical protein